MLNSWEQVYKLVICLGGRDIELRVEPADTLFFMGYEDRKGKRGWSGQMTVGALFRRLTREREKIGAKSHPPNVHAIRYVYPGKALELPTAKQLAEQ